MIKKFAAVSVLISSLMLTNCSSPALGIEQNKNLISISSSNNYFNNINKKLVLANNTKKINYAISKLKKQVGKTWYVFSGNTPNGWDCSGLTMWTYKQIGIKLEHSATAQVNSGKQYKTPKIGDIVAFGWNGYSGAGHVGIYIGNGLMIHAPHKGQKTIIEKVQDFKKFGYTKIMYIRFLQSF